MGYERSNIWPMKINRESILQATRSLLHEAKELRGRLRGKYVNRSHTKRTHVAGRNQGRGPEGQPLLSRKASAVKSPGNGSIRTRGMPGRTAPGNNYLEHPELLRQDLRSLKADSKASVKALMKNVIHAAELIRQEESARGVKVLDLTSPAACIAIIFKNQQFQPADIQQLIKLQKAIDAGNSDTLLGVLKATVAMGVVLKLTGRKGVTIGELEPLKQSSDPAERKLAKMVSVRAKTLDDASVSDLERLADNPARLNAVTDYRRDQKKKMFALLDTIAQQPASVRQHPKVQELEDKITALRNNPFRLNDDIEVNLAMRDCVRLLRDIKHFRL